MEEMIILGFAIGTYIGGYLAYNFIKQGIRKVIAESGQALYMYDELEAKHKKHLKRRKK